MARAGSSFFTVTDRPPPPGVGPETGPTIIWLRGEHDIATDADLRRTLARAISLNNAAIVVDLSKVELMSASTLGVIVAAWNDLRQQSRSLTMRAPSPHVRRVISICGLHNLLSAEERDRMAGVARKGLGSWVNVAEGEHGGGQLGPSTPAERAPVCVGQSAAWREPVPDEMPT
jgi:anti-sigma B factor antagonist